MKPYRGKIIITCAKETCTKGKNLIDADCAECEFAEVNIVDLADRKIAGYKKRTIARPRH